MANKSGGKPSDSRAGKRRDRNQRVGIRVPELGYYLIVTDTEETEKNYFEGLRDSIPIELKDRLVIKVEKAKTVELVERALELAHKEPQYRIPWIVFDRDQVKDFDDIIQAAEKSGVGAGWDGEKAIQIAERCCKKCEEDGKEKPSEMWPACMVQRLVGAIHEKIGDTNR